MGAEVGSLATGLMQNTKTTMYTATHQCTVDIRMKNTNSTDEDVILYLKPFGGSSVDFAGGTLDANGGFADELRRAMNVGDEIEGESTTTDVVTFIIQGAKQT